MNFVYIIQNIVFCINATDFEYHSVCIEEDCVHSNDCISKENLFLFLIKVTFNSYRNVGQVTTMCA